MKPFFLRNQFLEKISYFYTLYYKYVVLLGILIRPANWHFCLTRHNVQKDVSCSYTWHSSVTVRWKVHEVSEWLLLCHVLVVFVFTILRLFMSSAVSNVWINICVSVVTHRETEPFRIIVQSQTFQLKFITFRLRSRSSPLRAPQYQTVDHTDA